MGPPLEVAQGGSQQSGVAAELVDDEARHAATVKRLEDGHGAHEAREDPAPIDIAHQEHGRLRHGRHAHVGEVAAHEIGLGGAARALDDDDVGLPRDRRIARAHGRPEPRGLAVILPRRHVSHRLAEQHDLAHRIRARLEENRIHLDARGHPGRLGLHGLRPAHLAAIGSDVGIERHVLRLEGRDAKTVLGEEPTQAGHENGLAHVRARALEHDGAGRPGHLRVAIAAAGGSRTGTRRRRPRRRGRRGPWPRHQDVGRRPAGSARASRG